MITFRSKFLSRAMEYHGASRLGPFKVCPSCRDPLGAGRPPREHNVAGSTTMLAQGEPCGVYTLSCAKGLRCVPPPREHSPLQALLQGRGICAKHSRTSPTERPHPTGPHPSHSGDIEKAPCPQNAQQCPERFGIDNHPV
ncbi:insulin-like growth factor-binding protein 6b isoform X2 [Entelurus aequoreus]|uniref:insulin-like growth factor-binding protein 6b isoform X2 n=1 Tax=Entelurus aequoreus TaxID=161455 RepID=UPI002B1DEFF5|nr:insulin-like growth factor-binding protein 6b isoform X2 [Entelurus aequoreus]